MKIYKFIGNNGENNGYQQRSLPLIHVTLSLEVATILRVHIIHIITSKIIYFLFHIERKSPTVSKTAFSS